MTHQTLAGPLTWNQAVAKTSMLDVQFAQMSDAGFVRERNEDSLGYVLPVNAEEMREKGWLFALADGVAGHNGGEIASTLTIAALTAGFRSASAGDALLSLLPTLIERANLAVYEAGAASGRSGTAMATTVVVVGLRYDRAVVAHVGDSRCYLIRNGQAWALTKDHTVPAEQVRLGLLTPLEAGKASTANLLSRSVGSGLFVNVEADEHQIYIDDVLVLCSDGLHHSVKQTDLTKVISQGGSLDEAAQILVDLARERDGTDNISVQLIRVKGIERVGMYRGRHYKIR